MKDKKSNDIWVFVEIKEDGSVQPSSLELLNPGCLLYTSPSPRDRG